MFHINPPVVYSGAKIEIWFNPKNVMHKIEEVPEEDMPFVNAKLDNAHINFEGQITSESTFKGW